MSHESSGASLGEKKTQKLGCVYYALIDLSMGDTLDALVTVSTNYSLLVGASGFMHRNHPLHNDFAVVRSTPLGYFGGKRFFVALNGESKVSPSSM